MARRKPIPFDPQTDKQIWHRHLYLVICQYWNGLSSAQKQQWESAARRKRITGFNLFLRRELNKLPDILFFYPLLAGLGPSAIDFSGKLNHGTILGASWATGLFDNCVSLDGLDDRIDATNNPLFNFTTEPFSFELMVNPTVLNNYNFIISRGIPSTDGYGSFIRANGQVAFWTSSPALSQSQSSVGAISTGSWQKILFTRLGSSIRIFINGIDDTAFVAVHGNPKSSTRHLLFGIKDDLTSELTGKLDEVFCYNRPLTATEALIHSNRKESP